MDVKATAGAPVKWGNSPSTLERVLSPGTCSQGVYHSISVRAIRVSASGECKCVRKCVHHMWGPGNRVKSVRCV